MFAKNKKQPHYTGTRTFHHQGEMLHINFHEKLTLSYHHNRYSISIIEDYSGADLSRFIKKKSHAGRTIINVIQKLERQADVKVKIVQCDGASEFIGKNTDLGRFCRNKEIEIQFDNSVLTVLRKIVWLRKKTKLIGILLKQ